MGDVLVQADGTPLMWNRVWSWKSEHSTFNTGHYPRNNRLVAAANGDTFDFLCQF